MSLCFLSCGESFAAQAALYLDRLPASLESKRAGETDYSIPCSSALLLAGTFIQFFADVGTGKGEICKLQMFSKINP